MKRSELALELSQNAGITHEEAERCVEGLFGGRAGAGLLARALARGDRVALNGFGVFETRSRPERWGRNPRTGARIRIEARTRVSFRAGVALRQVVGGREVAAAVGNEGAGTPEGTGR